MKKRFLGLILLTFFIVLASCSNYTFKPNIDYKIDDFKVVDQNNETIMQ